MGLRVHYQKVTVSAKRKPPAQLSTGDSFSFKQTTTIVVDIVSFMVAPQVVVSEFSVLD